MKRFSIFCAYSDMDCEIGIFASSLNVNVTCYETGVCVNDFYSLTLIYLWNLIGNEILT